MKQSKIWWALFVALIIGMAMPASLNAQSKSLPSSIYFTGTVNYNDGYGDEHAVVKCYLDLRFSKGKVSGYTDYCSDDGYSARPLVGTYKAKSNGTYYLDVHVTDNSGCDWEGTYNPKTGVFSGTFSRRGLYESPKFKFTRSKK